MRPMSSYGWRQRSLFSEARTGSAGTLRDAGTASCRAAGRAAEGAHSLEGLKSRYDSHREAPATDGLAAEPCLKETSEGGIQERGDAADAGRALGARGDGRLHQPGSWHLPELPLPNLDVGVLRFSTILSSPSSRGSRLLSNSMSSRFTTWRRPLNLRVTISAAVTTLDSELPVPLITIVGSLSSVKTFAA